MRERDSWLLAVFVFFPACNDTTGGGDVSASTYVATPADIRSVCDAQCASSARCNPPGSPDADAGASCSDRCIRKLGNLGTHARADALHALANCHATLPCGINDDSCLGRAVAATGQGLDAALHAADVQACIRKHDECRGTAGNFTDDLCGALPVLIDGARAQAESCFHQTCDGVAACLAPIVGGT